MVVFLIKCFLILSYSVKTADDEFVAKKLLTNFYNEKIGKAEAMEPTAFCNLRCGA